MGNGIFEMNCVDLECLERVELGEKALMGVESDKCEVKLKSKNRMSDV